MALILFLHSEQSIFKNRPGAGRPPVITKRYVRQLIRTATKYPFVSARTLWNLVYNGEITSNLNRPPGAVFKVHVVKNVIPLLPGTPKTFPTTHQTNLGCQWSSLIRGCKKTKTNRSPHPSTLEVCNQFAANSCRPSRSCML